MRRLIFLCLVFLPYGLSAQIKPLDGFMGLKFGTSRSVVADALKAKAGVIDLENSNEKVLVLKNFVFANRKSYFMIVLFFNNQMYRAAVVFKPSVEAKTVELFDELVAEISEVYGEGQVYRNFKTPYKEGDGYEVTAIKTGHASYSAFWFVNSSEGRKNGISLTIDENASVTLTYEDGELTKKVVETQMAERAKDY